jgi:hypothetical protein
MKTSQIQKLHCGICGHFYSTAEAARRCELVPVREDKGVEIGDEVLITKGKGKGMKVQVESRYIVDMWRGRNEWERYWHTVSITAKVMDSAHHQHLTFDSYEPVVSASQKEATYITKDEKFYEAVRLGVADGIERMALRGSDMPGADFFAAIHDGVKEGVSRMDFDGVVAEAVADDLRKAKA